MSKTLKLELAEINIVRATDGTFIVRTIGENGVGEITTAVDFNSLTERLSELLVITPSAASQQEAPSQVQ